MINLMLCGNSKVADGLIIVLASYLRHNSEPVNVYFLTMDLSEVSRDFTPLTPRQAVFFDDFLKARDKLSSFHLIDAKKEFKELLGKSSNIRTYYTPYSMLRLLADRIPQIPDKVLYLDTDTLIVKDISSLYSIDINDYEFAASRDLLGRFWIYYNYQNSGVMLLNMKKIRETGLFEKCRIHLIRRRRFLPDQSALNKYVLKRRFIPMIYNCQGKPDGETVIKHFPKTMVWLPFPHTRNIKPWEIEKVHSVLHIHDYDDVLGEYSEIKKNFMNI